LPVSHGREALQEYLNRQSQDFGPSRYLILRASGEAAKIRVLTEQTDFVVGKFHRLQIPTSTGKFRVGDPILCTEDETCEVCASMKDDSERARLLSLYWLWVYFIDHVTQNPSTRAGTKPWEQVIFGNQVCYREPVEAPRLLLAGSRLAKVMDTYYIRLNSITDRDYTLVRSGEKLATEYSFIADAPAPFRADIASVIPTLASLEDVAYGRTGDTDPTGDTSRTAHEAAAPRRSTPAAGEDLVDLGTDAESTPAEDPDLRW